MSLVILGLFKAIAPLFPAATRRFAPAGAMGCVSRPGAASTSTRPHPIAGHAVNATIVGERPLRVTRLLEQDCNSANAGRMVMSGRFADVCAELDRLVALETAREAARTRH